ncbi:MAG: hypothetical protein FWH02_01300 [Oscillospiraceae bacterium]|nr:hypothetical protein [Oscillospiraceae bacterium]
MKNSSKSGLFLIEMIIAIAFFSLAAAICTGLFVSARVISRDTYAANMATLTAQSVAEVFKATGGSGEKTAAYFSTSVNGGEFIIAFDNDWAIIEEAYTDVGYVVRVTIDESSALKQAKIDVARRSDLNKLYNGYMGIFSLEVKYYGGGGGIEA